MDTFCENQLSDILSEIMFLKYGKETERWYPWKEELWNDILNSLEELEYEDLCHLGTHVRELLSQRCVAIQRSERTSNLHPLHFGHP